MKTLLQKKRKVFYEELGGFFRWEIALPIHGRSSEIFNFRIGAMAIF
jgi:hypothetical protein